MSLFDRNNSLNKRLLIENRGENRITRLTHVAMSKSTAQQMLELAWTAGPVTLLASIGGYYIGHGKALPTETLIFFIAYTVIAGLIGLVAHIVNRLSRDKKGELTEAQLAQVMGTLPDLVLDLRDLHLESLAPEQRTLEAALILLRDVDLGPRWLASAVRSIGGSDRLAEAVEDIDIYRRAGMSCRARDIYQANLVGFQSLALSLRQRLPPLADSLEMRFSGDGYNPRAGVTRGGYFIERIFSAIEDEDDTLMTLDDVEEVYTLLFELLCGRHIPMLACSFSGGSKLAKETDALEKLRLNFRIVRAKAYSRLLALATFLSENVDDAVLASRAGLTGKELLGFCSAHIENLVNQAQGSAKKHRQLKTVLEKSLALYHQAYIAYRRTDQVYQEFQIAVEHWKQHLELHQDLGVAFTESGGGKGLQIVEDSIYISDQDKLKVVQTLSNHFHHRRRTGEDPVKRAQAAKQLAIRIALILDDVIHISRSEVQRAIYNSSTLNMGVFDRDLSTKTKIGWGEAQAKEIEKDMSSASIALVIAIYRFYGLKLDPESQHQLAKRYGAKLEQFEQVYQESVQVLSGHAHIPVRPFPVPRAPLEWRLVLVKPPRGR